MASSVQEIGYEDELFQHPVDPSLHCCICINVIKDPVMCHNEHIFCRACITRHLMYSQTCPTCMQPLTVETLRQATRGIRNMLDELKIRCKHFDRGCRKFIQLGDLERHVADCGFAPAVCSNEGCQLLVNKQDLLHHETAVCGLRRIKCHSCNDIRREIDTVKVELAAIDQNLKGVGETLRKNEKTIADKLERNETSVKAVKEHVFARVELVQQQLNKQEESNRQLEADNVEIKQSLNEIIKQLERVTPQISHGIQAEQMKKGIAEGGGSVHGLDNQDTDKRLHEVTQQMGTMRTSPENKAEENTVESVETDREPKIAIAGGESDEGVLQSVKVFTLLDGTSVIILSAGLRCCICTNVIKDPVMCPNEDIFCRACITERLMCWETCPTCMQPLAVETLRKAPEDIKDKLNELQLELPRYDKVEWFRDKDKSLHEVKKQPERMRTSPEVDTDERRRLKKQTVESAEMVRGPKIAIVGGQCNEGILNSVRMFNPLDETWVVAMQSMNECRSDVSSVLHQSSIFVMGGLTPNGATASIEKLWLDTVENNQTCSENVLATLPSQLVGHCCVVYNQRLMVVGGYNAERSEYSNSITEIPLVTPYASERVLATMKQRRCYHGVAIFGDRILIVGGRSGISSNSILRSVVMYDITKNEFQELAPLPYPVHSMATVKWRDNVIIMGGVDRNRRPLNNVFMYDINAQESRDLPNMNHKRKGCVAAIVGDAVIVMGGEDEEGNCLKSVEKFTFGNQAWAVLPEMPEERNFATAIAY